MNIPGTEKCFVFYFWHSMLVRPAMKRLLCLKAKNGLIINSASTRRSRRNTSHFLHIEFKRSSHKQGETLKS